MKLSAFKINCFLFFRLPSAFWCGVRLKQLNAATSLVSVRHRWINQNPFRSMYFAVQAMAAELSTGALVLYHVRQSGHDISMLVASHQSTFSKKATGRINFACADGPLVAQAIEQALATAAGTTLIMKSTGTNEQGEQVSHMQFEWTLKIKSNANKR